MSLSLPDEKSFARQLFSIMQQVNSGLEELELYEFEYALENLVPEKGWASQSTPPLDKLELEVNERRFYESIQVSPRSCQKTILDLQIANLTRELFVGLVNHEYPLDWIRNHFYFDIRGFYFLHRTTYFTEQAKAHLGGSPFRCFEPKQQQFEKEQAIGYKAFRKANEEIDQFFIESIMKLVDLQGTPILIAIAGPTAAGKTEIVSRLRNTLTHAGRSVAGIEMDHFLTDRDYREQHGIDSMGKEALHYEIFMQCLRDICAGKTIRTPRYDFILATSSHDLDGRPREGCSLLTIEPADTVFIEGNFPFLLEEIANLIGIKIVYLTDDPVRMKRKWRRDMDYRKKYDLYYFLNRYFREQYLMAESAYIPQIEMSDLVVDTTQAQFWASPEIQKKLSS